MKTAKKPRSRRWGGHIVAMLAMALLASIVTIQPATAEPLEAGPRVVITSDKAGEGKDGWFQHEDGTKQWISPECRADLEAAGHQPAILEWNEISSMTEGQSLSCEELADLAPQEEDAPPGDTPEPETATAQDAGRIVITSDKVGEGKDGWFQHEDGAKQWVSSECRADLEAAGHEHVVLEWVEISAMAGGTSLSCDELVASAASSTEPEPTPRAPSPDPGPAPIDLGRIIVTADKASGGSDGWYQHITGVKQWISSECRTDLETAGHEPVVLEWVEISAIPDGSSVACEVLVQIASGSPIPSPPIPEPSPEPQDPGGGGATDPTPDPQAPPAPAPASVRVHRDNGYGLNVRVCAGTSCDLQSVFPTNSTFVVTCERLGGQYAGPDNQESRWYRVGDRPGFVAAAWTRTLEGGPLPNCGSDGNPPPLPDLAATVSPASCGQYECNASSNPVRGRATGFTANGLYSINVYMPDGRDAAEAGVNYTTRGTVAADGSVSWTWWTSTVGRWHVNIKDLNTGRTVEATFTIAAAPATATPGPGTGNSQPGGDSTTPRYDDFDPSTGKLDLYFRCSSLRFQSIRWVWNPSADRLDIGAYVTDRDYARREPQGAWNELNRCIPSSLDSRYSSITRDEFARSLDKWVASDRTMFLQFDCHATLGVGVPGTRDSHFGGIAWGLESHRPEVSNKWTWIRNGCNW